jgi:UDP-4-amino-4,6-dideoxy-N-acetyl-beta-L-altrosamine N-acetyltransferase
MDVAWIGCSIVLQGYITMIDLGRLRKIRSDELELMLQWRNEPSVRENMYTQHEITLSEHVDWWRKISAIERFKYFMYEFQQVPLGIVSFSDIDGTSSNASWAFYASPDAPRGTGSKMEVLALDQAFKVMGLHKLYCEVLAFNKPVLRLHEKFGFKVEGLFKDQFRSSVDFADVYRLGLFASDWNDARNRILDKLTNPNRNQQ